jgi:uncharacterized membrane protein
MPDYIPPPPQSPPPGRDKKTTAALCYLFSWVTGIIFLVIEKNDADIRYHAAQSIVFLGGLNVCLILADVLPIGLIREVVWLAYIIGWIYCLYKAWTGAGERFEIPYIGATINPYIEKLTQSV